MLYSQAHDYLEDESQCRDSRKQYYERHTFPWTPPMHEEVSTPLAMKGVVPSLGPAVHMAVLISSSDEMFMAHSLSATDRTALLMVLACPAAGGTANLHAPNHTLRSMSHRLDRVKVHQWVRNANNKTSDMYFLSAVCTPFDTSTC